MSIISEVKCARCDRKYSGVRSRCPHCGARRIGSGKYSEEGDNSKGKMIVGILIMVVLVVAAGILLFTAPKDEDDAFAAETPPTETEESTPPIPDENDVIDMPGIGPSVTPPESEDDETDAEPVDTAPPGVTSVTITYAGYMKDDFTEPVGSKIPLKVRIEPPGAEYEEDIVWKSSDTSVFDVVPAADGLSCNVTIIGSGSARSATLTVSIGDVSFDCIVRVGK
ncbi:MAG: hypothetical protein FWH33_11070 [Oscillospiraceae bacterium]|nr:hypothetical protein [Oscillospiraceae bacterium]